VALPDIVAFGHRKQPRHLAPVEHVRQRLALLRHAQHERGVAVEGLVLDAEAKKHLSAAAVRAWLPIAGRRPASATRKRRRSGGRTRRRSSIPLSFRKRTQAVTSRS
jgi:hypothetical protein